MGNFSFCFAEFHVSTVLCINTTLWLNVRDNINFHEKRNGF